MSEDPAQAARLVASAARIAVLTGAGISTASGIPDFRGPQGRWTLDPDAERMSTLSDYLRDPAVRAKAWGYRAARELWAAEPNPGHLALLGLERQGRLTGIVTQNTDGLHLVAGSSPGLVHEVHGSVRTWRCEACGRTGPMIDQVRRVWDGEADPRCPSCGGVTRATVILFGESLVPEVLDAAIDAVLAADLLLVVGTSLTVYPVAGLVPLGVNHGARLVIVNDQPTPFDDLADALVHEPIAVALPLLCAADQGE